MTEIGGKAESRAAPFRILAVCTGNICRSPMVERLLQAELDKNFPNQFAVESAGTSAIVGNSIDPQVANFIRSSGGDPANFASRQLTAQILERQDLILALTRGHRGRVVEISPIALKKTFTLREFARILSTLQIGDDFQGPDRWKSAIPKALRAKSAQVGDPQDDDVVDPYKQNSDVYRQMRLDLLSSLSNITAKMAPRS